MNYPIAYAKVPQAPAPSVMKREQFWKEWKTALQVPRLIFNLPKLVTKKKGKNETVILIPGWKAPEAVMEPLRLYLKALGYNAIHWGQGTNHGEVEHNTEKLVKMVENIKEQSVGKVSLIGWSLGGVVARETARKNPQHIAKVITYGTPVIGGPIYTLGALSWGKEKAERIERELNELNNTNPIQVPLTIIFTKEDYVVSWPACIDKISPNAQHYEVGSSHIGLGIDPDVWHLVGNQLQ